MPVIRPAGEPKKVMPLLQRNGLRNLEAQLGEFGAPETFVDVFGWGQTSIVLLAIRTIMHVGFLGGCSQSVSKS